MTPDQILEQAREAFGEGIAHFEADRLPQAKAAFQRALKLAPGRASIVLNLGVTLVQLGEYADGAPLLESLVKDDPGAVDAWMALAHARFEQGEWTRAIAAFEQALRLGSEQPALRFEYAKALIQAGRPEDAVAPLRTALERAPQSAESWYAFGDLLRGLGRDAEAAHAYRQSLEHGAEPELVNYVLSALKLKPVVEHPPRVYVQTLFDQYANDFEQHLVGQLGYQGHRLLVEQLPTACPSRFERVLDLGCGTGLCGEHVRARAGWLAGVDLSAAMVEKSRARGIYDQLTAADVHEFLQADVGGWQLVLAADVFIYVGALERLFGLLAWRVCPGGWVGFTAESAPAGSGAQLLASLRYAHAADYIESLARSSGFVVRQVSTQPIRFDQKEPVMGEYWYLQRQ